MMESFVKPVPREPEASRALESDFGERSTCVFDGQCLYKGRYISWDLEVLSTRDSCCILSAPKQTLLNTRWTRLALYERRSRVPPSGLDTLPAPLCLKSRQKFRITGPSALHYVETANLRRTVRVNSISLLAFIREISMPGTIITPTLLNRW